MIERITCQLEPALFAPPQRRAPRSFYRPLSGSGTTFVVALLSLLSFCSGAVSALDRLVLQAPDKANPVILSGDIADYNAERIEVHLTVGNPVHEYPASEVLMVETVHTQAHRDGIAHFIDGDLDAARTDFEQSLQDEPRLWVKREILGWLVRIAIRQNDRTLAGKRFLEIVATEPAPREYSLAPLVWGSVSIDSNLQQHGRLWLTGSSEVERLMGASVLLLDQRYSETAQAEMNRLARVADSRVAALARTQLWRLRVTSPDITENELASWEQTISDLPAELRAGPCFLLGRAASQRSDYDRAAAAFCWLPTVYRDNESLTAQAAMGAATALQRIGRLGEARLLLEELTTQYRWSSAAVEARNLLTTLHAETPPQAK